MRLIDADALLKQLLEAKDDEIIKAVIGLVQTQPTAYDVKRCGRVGRRKKDMVFYQVFSHI